MVDLAAGQRAALQLLDRLHHGRGDIGHRQPALLAAERDLLDHNVIGRLVVRVVLDAR